MDRRQQPVRCGSTEDVASRGIRVKDVLCPAKSKDMGYADRQ